MQLYSKRGIFLGALVLTVLLSLIQFLNFHSKSNSVILPKEGSLEYLQNELNRINWSPGRNISRKCSLRENRKNPFRDLESFPCPGNKEFGKDLPFETLSSSPMGPYSKRECTKEKHCVYENVCIQNDMVSFFTDNPNEDKGSFGWYPYRDGGHRSFSWHYGVNLVKESDQWPSPVRWVKGTNLWYDQSYDHMCHPGHSSEFYDKLVQVRKQFPYTLDRILYAFDVEVFRTGPYAYKYCGYPCNMMRIGFEKENFSFPQITWMQEPIGEPYQYHRKFRFTEEPLCFERLIVPSNSHQHFTSMEAAEDHRNAGLKMCNIPHRDKPKPTDRKKVLFFQRGYDRQIYNGEELCRYTRERPGEVLDSYMESDDVEDFCDFMATIYSADIIVTIDGSSNFMLSFARPGSVVIMIHPFNFRVPDWKLLCYYAGLRILELVTLDKTYSIGAEADPHWHMDGNHYDVFETSLRECTHILCRIAIRGRNTFVPLDTFEAFMTEALNLLQLPDNSERKSCEKPAPWPVPIPGEAWSNPYFQTHFAQYSFQLNYDICEPPYPSCNCCVDEGCLNATSRLTRPF